MSIPAIVCRGFFPGPDATTAQERGEASDIQAGLVAFLGTQAGVVELIGAPPAMRCYPELAPDDAGYPRLVYTLLDDGRPNTLTGTGGWGEARLHLQCWGDGTRQGHLAANALYLALIVALDGYRGPMGAVGVQYAETSNGAKASPPPAEGKAKADACATLDLYLFFDDL